MSKHFENYQQILGPGAWVEEAGERIARLSEARLVTAPASTLSWSRIRRQETSGL